MLMRFSLFVLLTAFVICQAASLYNRGDDDDDDLDLHNQFRSLTPQQLAELDQFLSHKVYGKTAAASSDEVLHRNTRYPDDNSMVKRDTLWTTTEVLECIRRLKHSKEISKLDLVTEMLNCYRRLRQVD